MTDLQGPRFLLQVKGLCTFSAFLSSLSETGSFFSAKDLENTS